LTNKRIHYIVLRIKGGMGFYLYFCLVLVGYSILFGVEIVGGINILSEVPTISDQIQIQNIIFQCLCG